jgi:hypothetical protein
MSVEFFHFTKYYKYKPDGASKMNEESFSGRWVFHVGVPVPHQFADVKLIVDQPGACFTSPRMLSSFHLPPEGAGISSSLSGSAFMAYSYSPSKRVKLTSFMLA